MPARNPPPPGKAWTPDKVRERIKTSLIVNALTKHILKNKEMSRSQVAAALGLLKKTLPDLQSISVTGKDGEGPVQLELKGSDVHG